MAIQSTDLILCFKNKSSKYPNLLYSVELYKERTNQHVALNTVSKEPFLLLCFHTNWASSLYLRYSWCNFCFVKYDLLGSNSGTVLHLKLFISMFFYFFYNLPSVHTACQTTPWHQSSNSQYVYEDIFVQELFSVKQAKNIFSFICFPRVKY